METIPITSGHIASPPIHNLGTVCTRDVANTVAEYFDIPLCQLFSRRRTGHLALVRQIAMALAYRLTDDSLCEVGRHFDRDHGTVLHATRVIEGQSSYDAKLRHHIAVIEQRLNRSPIGRVVT